MLQTDAPAIENQIDSEPMKDREALRINAAPLDTLNTAEGFGGFLPVAMIVAAAGALVFGLLASSSGKPVQLPLASCSLPTILYSLPTWVSVWMADFPS